MSERERSSSRNGLSHISTADGSVDLYDHAIDLVDATTPGEGQSKAPSRTDSPGWRQLARNTSVRDIARNASVREHMNRRRYAKWQQGKFDSQNGNTSAADNVGKDQEDQAQAEQSRGRKVPHREHSDSVAVDFGHPPTSPETAVDDRTNTRQKPQNKAKDKRKEDSVVDILYENQRGSFFCGIPLYSHSSLLQFDPSPWVNKDYKPSPVNITNAQVPDPTWQWAWKHWYVDMTNDVDEDGWQYSFAFFGNFSWHGTHPWFHSFCRRRRWLRMRTKAPQAVTGKVQSSSMSAAHRLNTDYFTIHSKRELSPSLLDGGPKTARADSYISRQSTLSADEPPEEINDISSLLKALRLATVDRQKLDAVKQFVELGGEELAYLKDRIPDIMQFLVFQNSRRQILEYLRQKAREAQEHREEHESEKKPEGEAEHRRIDNLLKAVEVADEQIKGLEYWSDRKHIMVTTDHTKSLIESPLVTIFDKPTDDQPSNMDDSPAGEIKGIAKQAGIGNERVHETTYRGATLRQEEHPEEHKVDKGKGKMREDEAGDSEPDAEDIERLPPRLQYDQLVIPEGEGEGNTEAKGT